MQLAYLSASARAVCEAEPAVVVVVVEPLATPFEGDPPHAASDTAPTISTTTKVRTDRWPPWNGSLRPRACVPREHPPTIIHSSPSPALPLDIYSGAGYTPVTGEWVMLRIGVGHVGDVYV
jgi:hypothetical protein